MSQNKVWPSVWLWWSSSLAEIGETDPEEEKKQKTYSKKPQKMGTNWTETWLQSVLGELKPALWAEPAQGTRQQKIHPGAQANKKSIQGPP